MFERVDTIKKLWNGEKVVRKNGANKEIEIEIYPKPYKKDLTIWSTAIGNPETYVESAKRGLNIMTCLLDQEIPELKEKIALYRKTLKEYGYNPEEKKVAIFLHTFVGDSVESVKETIKTPFMNYLKITLDLIVKFAQNADIPADPSKMSEEEKESLLEFAFERYFTSRTLLGDIERVKEIALTLKEIGVDEIACLLDFGLDSTQIMDSLKKLASIL